MSKNTQTAKGMLVFGALLLAGCATPTLNFVIPKDKVEHFNKCMVPAHLIELGKNEDNKDDAKFWLNSLRELYQPACTNRSCLLLCLNQYRKYLICFMPTRKSSLFLKARNC